MKRAIEVLENEIVKCNYMTKFYETELSNHVGITADQTKIEKLKRELTETADIKQECIDAIEYLKSVK